MKLLLCPHCGDVIVLKREPRSCECSRCTGKYLKDGLTAVYTDGIPFAIANRSLIFMIRYQNDDERKVPIDAFSIDKDEKTYRKVTEDEFDEST